MQEALFPCNTAQAAQSQTHAAAFYNNKFIVSNKGGNITNTRDNRKSQAGMETIIAVGVVLLIFVFLSFLVYYINSGKNDARERSFAENSCQRISGAISDVYILGPGAEFDLDISYNATFESGNLIYIESGEKETFCRSSVLFTDGANNTFSLKQGTIHIRNIDGAVVIKGD